MRLKLLGAFTTFVILTNFCMATTCKVTEKDAKIDWVDCTPDNSVLEDKIKKGFTVNTVLLEELRGSNKLQLRAMETLKKVDKSKPNSGPLVDITTYILSD